MAKKKPPTAPPAAAEPVDLAAEIERRTEARMAARRLDDGPTWAAYADLLRLDDPAPDDIAALCDIAVGLGLTADDIELHRAAIAAEAEAAAAARDLTAARRATADLDVWWREVWARQSHELQRHRAEVLKHQDGRRDCHIREQAAIDAEHARGSIRREWPRLFGLDPTEHQRHPGDILPGELRNRLRDIEQTRGDRRNRP